ncbi:Gfo/Idh/MocA family oxidoreductase [Pseudarthrobacter phenanthrenivorans]|uniref:Gfo/Idh/MocA family protein n=1 Tax=Pseudarthrobacter phenanthrenivorans TaxID=361575 RepID=UPI00344F9772
MDTGNISREYLMNLIDFPDLDVRWVVGRDRDRAAARAAEFNIPRSGQLQDALADDAVEIVVDLTVPSARLKVGLSAIQAGKHVWSEKPMALNPSQARALLGAARRCGVRMAVGPDTSLGPALQTAREALDRDRIGQPVYATTSYESSGPEQWHPNPEFLYAAGAGPLYDVGPYFIGGLIHLLGSVRRVNGLATRCGDTRRITVGPKTGTSFPVLTPTTVLALIEFSSNAVAQARFSYDSIGSGTGSLNIFGTAGQLDAVDGQALFDRPAAVIYGDGAMTPMPQSTTAFRRGLGIVDLARSIREGVPEKTPGELGIHVLEVIAASDEATRTGYSVDIDSQAPDIAPLSPRWDPGETTLTVSEGREHVPNHDLSSP